MLHEAAREGRLSQNDSILRVRDEPFGSLSHGGLYRHRLIRDTIGALRHNTHQIEALVLEKPMDEEYEEAKALPYALLTGIENYIMA